MFNGLAWMQMRLHDAKPIINSCVTEGRKFWFNYGWKLAVSEEKLYLLCSCETLNRYVSMESASRWFYVQTSDIKGDKNKLCVVLKTFPCDIEPKKSPNSLQKKETFRASESAGKRGIYTNTNTHLNSLDSSVEKKGNPLLPHQFLSTSQNSSYTFCSDMT